MKKIIMAVLWLLTVKESDALVLKQQMGVHIGVFVAAEVTLQYDNGASRFVISADVRTANLFNTLYPFNATYESNGKRFKGKILPELYQTRSQSRNHIRTKKIFYDKKGVAYKRISTKDEKISEAPISGISKTADAADLQSVFAEFIQNLADYGHCNLVREIDDGKKHYRFISKDMGETKRYFELFKRKETVRFCSVYVENLKNNNDNILWNVSADKPIKLWVGKDEKTGMPFVFEIVIDSTPLGALKVMPLSLDIK